MHRCTLGFESQKYIWSSDLRNYSTYNARDSISKLQSFTHHQFSSPRFRDLIKCAWHKSGHVEERPQQFETLVDFCFEEKSNKMRSNFQDPKDILVFSLEDIQGSNTLINSLCTYLHLRDKYRFAPLISHLDSLGRNGRSYNSPNFTIDVGKMFWSTIKSRWRHASPTKGSDSGLYGWAGFLFDEGFQFRPKWTLGDTRHIRR